MVEKNDDKHANAPIVFAQPFAVRGGGWGGDGRAGSE